LASSIWSSIIGNYLATKQSTLATVQQDPYQCMFCFLPLQAPFTFSLGNVHSSLRLKVRERKEYKSKELNQDI